MYVIGPNSDSVHQYTLSTAWSVSSATHLQSFSVASQENNSRGVFFIGDGSQMFVIGTSSVGVNVYNLSTPWDISTATFVNVFSTSGQDTLMQGIYIKPDGTKMYIVGNTNDTVYQYTVPSIDIQLTGPTSIAALDVQQDLNVYGKTTVGSLTATSGLFTAGLNASGILTATSGVFNSGITAGTGLFTTGLTAATGSFTTSLSAVSGNFSQLTLNNVGVAISGLSMVDKLFLSSNYR